MKWDDLTWNVIKLNKNVMICNIMEWNGIKMNGMEWDEKGWKGIKYN